MKYILKYYTESKYLHFRRQYYKEFDTIKEVRIYLLNNINKIKIYSIYKLSDLNDK